MNFKYHEMIDLVYLIIIFSQSIELLINLSIYNNKMDAIFREFRCFDT